MSSASNLLGIPGMTPAGIGIWGILTLLVGVLVWWVRGMPDRRRALTEAKVAEGEADGANWARFQGEIARLDEKVRKQGVRIDELEKEVSEVRAAKAFTDAENVKLRAQLDSEGRIRQEAAKVVALDRIEIEAASRARAK